MSEITLAEREVIAAAIQHVELRQMPGRGPVPLELTAAVKKLQAERDPWRKAMLDTLQGWIEGAMSNHDAMGHRGESTPCWDQFTAEDIRRMVDDAAQEVAKHDPR